MSIDKVKLEDELSNILNNNPNIVEYEVNSNSGEEPEVFFKLNTGNGRHTEKHGGEYEYYRFYQFKGKVRGTEDLNYRLKYRQPPE